MEHQPGNMLQEIRSDITLEFTKGVFAEKLRHIVLNVVTNMTTDTGGCLDQYQDPNTLSISTFAFLPVSFSYGMPLLP
jgi:hypothetical protein